MDRIVNNGPRDIVLELGAPEELSFVELWNSGFDGQGDPVVFADHCIIWPPGWTHEQASAWKTASGFDPAKTGVVPA